MKGSAILPTGASVELTDDVVLGTANSLTDALHGLEIPEFSTRMGAEFEVTQTLLKQRKELLGRFKRGPNGETV